MRDDLTFLGVWVGLPALIGWGLAGLLYLLGLPTAAEAVLWIWVVWLVMSVAVL